MFFALAMVSGSLRISCVLCSIGRIFKSKEKELSVSSLMVILGVMTLMNLLMSSKRFSIVEDVPSITADAKVLKNSVTDVTLKASI